jgi:hypothetical protein
MAMLSKLVVDYNLTLHCSGAPHCYHSTVVDAAFLERYGDMSLEWLRDHARCVKCGRLGATTIASPAWTGPADLDPRKKRG